MHEVLVNRLEGLSLPRKSVVRLTDRSDMTLDIYRGRKTTMQQQQQQQKTFSIVFTHIRTIVSVCNGTPFTTEKAWASGMIKPGTTVGETVPRGFTTFVE